MAGLVTDFEPLGVDDLPAGFKRLSYLESTGTQWIDTGVVSNGNRMLKQDAVIRWSSNAYERQLMGHNYGGFTGINGRYWDSLTGVGNVFADTGEYWRVSWWVHLRSKGTTLIDAKGTEYKSDQIEATVLQYPGTPVLIFNIGGFPGASCKCRIKQYRITEGGYITHDYVPILDNEGAPCLYDKVTNACFYNQGTGQFLYG